MASDLESPALKAGFDIAPLLQTQHRMMHTNESVRPLSSYAPTQINRYADRFRTAEAENLEGPVVGAAASCFRSRYARFIGLVREFGPRGEGAKSPT